MKGLSLHKSTVIPKKLLAYTADGKAVKMNPI